ncbi:MAG: preprotein translocase subunit SecE [Anaerolineaceae bacterium]|nr:preprotein translocase subunit SecE [Anaerolineaceae bacterium]
MAARNADKSWLLVDPWPSAEDPEYPAGTRVTDEVKEKLVGTTSRRGQEVRLRFKPADPYRYAIHVQLGVPVLLLAIGAFGIFRLVNGRRFADFLIATESEMKKVHWSSRAELIGSTVVVIVTVLILAAYIFGVDYLVVKGLRLLGVLRS